MSNSVKRRPAIAPALSAVSKQGAPGLYTRQGTRKYLTRAERQRVLVAIEQLDTDSKLLALTVAWTGARISEVLALTAHAFDVEAAVVAIVTLKRRRLVVREVPIPPELMVALDARYGLKGSQGEADRSPTRLWSCCRGTAWRQIKTVMAAAGIHGQQASPRGLRHSFAVQTLQSGVPVTLLQKWLGHARLTTTAIYANVSGPEERLFADRFRLWSQENAGAASAELRIGIGRHAYDLQAGPVAARRQG